MTSQENKVLQVNGYIYVRLPYDTKSIFLYGAFWMIFKASFPLPRSTHTHTLTEFRNNLHNFYYQNLWRKEMKKS